MSDNAMILLNVLNLLPLGELVLLPLFAAINYEIDFKTNNETYETKWINK